MQDECIKSFVNIIEDNPLLSDIRKKGYLHF